MGHFPCFALLWLLLIQTRWDVRTYQRYLIPAILMISYSHDYSLAWTLISYERERYVFVHVFFLCDCGWSRVLSSFFRAGKVCFVFLCSITKCLWTPSEAKEIWNDQYDTYYYDSTRYTRCAWAEEPQNLQELLTESVGPVHFSWLIMFVEEYLTKFVSPLPFSA